MILGKKTVLLYTNVLKNIQIVNSEVIVISRRIPPPQTADSLRSWRQSLLKSLTVFPFAFSFPFPAFRFFSRPAHFFISTAARAERRWARRAPASHLPGWEPQRNYCCAPDWPAALWGWAWWWWRSKCPVRRMRSRSRCRFPRCCRRLQTEENGGGSGRNFKDLQMEELAGAKLSPMLSMISLPLCAVFNQMVISFRAAIWLRITVCGLVMSTSTSGLVPWLANPFPMTWSSYLCESESAVNDPRQAPSPECMQTQAGLTCSLLYRSSTRRRGRSSHLHTPSRATWTRIS